MSRWQLSSLRLCLLDDSSLMPPNFDEIYFQITQNSGEHTFSSLAKRNRTDVFFEDKVILHFDDFQSVSAENPSESKPLMIRFFSYHQNENAPLAFSNLQTSKQHTQIYHGSSKKYLGQLYYSLIEMPQDNQLKLVETPKRLNVILSRSSKNPKSSMMFSPYSKQEKKHFKTYSCITQQDFDFSVKSQTYPEKSSLFHPIQAKTPLNKFLYSAYFENEYNLDEIQKPSSNTENKSSKHTKGILTLPNLELELQKNTGYDNTDQEFDLSLNPKEPLNIQHLNKPTDFSIPKVEDILQVSSTKASTTATECQQSDSQREQRSSFSGDFQKQISFPTRNNLKSTNYQLEDTYLPAKLSSEISQINRSSSTQQLSKKDSLNLTNPSSISNLPPKSSISSINQAINTVAQFPVSGTQNASNTILQRQRSAASITIQQIQKQHQQTIPSNQPQYQSQNLFPRRLSNAWISPTSAPSSSPFIKTTPNQISYPNLNQPSMINPPCLPGNNNYCQVPSSIPMQRQAQQLQAQVPPQLTQFNPYQKSSIPFKMSIGSNSFF